MSHGYIRESCMMSQYCVGNIWASMYTRYTHAHHVPHAEHVERSDQMVKRSRDDVEDFEDMSGTSCCPPPVLFTAQRAKLSHIFNMAKITSSCYMVFIALGIISTCLCKFTFLV